MVSISIERKQNILPEELSMRKLSARWVPPEYWNKVCPKAVYLSPSYFNYIYTDHTSMHNHVTISYAEDTTPLVEADTYEDQHTDGESHVDNISKWLKNDNLNVNQEKTKAILFKTKSNYHPDYAEFNRRRYPVVFHAKLLGIVVDQNLKWKDHIDLPCNKLSSLWFALRQLRDIVNNDILRSVYFACYCSRI